MFEAKLAAVLQQYLGDYVHGLDKESLKISVWKGDVVLRNLRLKADALKFLGIAGLVVKAGLLGSRSSWSPPRAGQRSNTANSWVHGA